MGGADLNNIVKTQRLSDDHVQFLVYQILRGMKYVHSAGIIHRDLKPSNIAVNEDCELKILDFGLARPTENEMTGYVATRWYRAPEIMLNWMHYNHTVDLWSVGCIMAEMLTGKTLFPGSDHIDQLTRILLLCGTPDSEFLHKITSDEARNYIRSLPKMEKKTCTKFLRGPIHLRSTCWRRCLSWTRTRGSRRSRHWRTLTWLSTPTPQMSLPPSLMTRLLRTMTSAYKSGKKTSGMR